MKVEIWHKSDGAYKCTHTLDLYAVTDQAVCELTYLHTKPGSISQMQDPDFQGTQVGDLIVVLSEVGDSPNRAYEVQAAACNGIAFEKVSVPH
jgi:hypothetical protein